MRAVTRRAALCAVAAALPPSLTGCAGLDTTRSETTDGSRTDAATTTPANDSTEVVSTTRTDTRTTVPAERITPYRTLTDDGKRLVRSLVENGTAERPADRIPPSFEDPTYVRYDDELHEIRMERAGRSLAEYVVRLDPVEASAVEGDAELVRFTNLSTDGKAAVETILADGSFTARHRPVPPGLFDHRYLLRGERYYRIRVVVGDIPIWRLSVRNASE